MHMYRMFSSALDVKPNEHGEYEVAKGVSASIFRAILVREAYMYCNMPLIVLLSIQGILQTWCS